MIRREITICCEGFQKHKLLFNVVLKQPFSLQAVIRIPFTEEEIPINFCPFCGREMPAYQDETIEIGRGNE